MVNEKIIDVFHSIIHKQKKKKNEDGYASHYPKMVRVLHFVNVDSERKQNDNY
jgi:hypothetical protein